MPAEENGRTHEPNLRELTAQLDDLKELMAVEIRAVREVMSERDKRYDSQFKSGETAVASALAAAEKQTTAAFLSSEKAIVKAEEAQKAYNQTHNDLNRKMDDQYKSMMPRPEAEKQFESWGNKMADAKEQLGNTREEVLRELGILRESSSREIGALRTALMAEIQGLRESRTDTAGRASGLHAGWGYLIGFVGIISTLLTIGLAIRLLVK